MKTEFSTFHHHESGGADHHTPPLTTNSPSFHGGADHLTSPLTTNQSSIFTTFNNNHYPFSYLSLLNSTPSSFSSDATTTNYLHADSAQEIINAQILYQEQKMINAHIYEEQKMINNNAQILKKQKMVNNGEIFGEQKMMNAQNFEEQKMCVANDEKLKKKAAKNRKEKFVSRKMRQKISEKNSYLQKLLPWVNKMDIATMYDETANYIKFLEAQVSVLHSMPLYNTPPTSSNSVSGPYLGSGSYPSPYSGSSSYSGPYSGLGFGSGHYLGSGSGSGLYSGPGSGSGSYAGPGSGSGSYWGPVSCLGSGSYSGCGWGSGMELLRKLSRQEVLRVMMNSERVQTVLSRNGWCVYTVEQMEGMLENKVAVTGEAPGDVLPSYLLDGMLWNYY